MAKEIWKTVPGWESSYEVSNRGSVRSLPRTVICRDGRQYRWKGCKMSLCKDSDGYLICKFKRPGEKMMVKTHQLVAEVFIGPRPPGQETRHRNGKRDDNRPRNLCYGTSADNSADMIKHGNSPRGRRNPQVKLTKRQVLSIRRRYAAGGITQRELGSKYGIHPKYTSLIITKARWGWL
jgi:hypothetical protein